MKIENGNPGDFSARNEPLGRRWSLPTSSMVIHWLKNDPDWTFPRWWFPCVTVPLLGGIYLRPRSRVRPGRLAPLQTNKSGRIPRPLSALIVTISVSFSDGTLSLGTLRLWPSSEFADALFLLRITYVTHNDNTVRQNRKHDRQRTSIGISIIL